MGCCCKKNKNYANLNEQFLPKDGYSSMTQNSSNVQLKLSDFKQIKLIGKGAFGTVVLVKLKSNNKYYAMKIINKEAIKENKQKVHTKTERDIMVQASSPFIVKIHFAFQDDNNLYIVTEFLQGGDIFFHIYKEKKFPEEKARFYAAELVLALDFLHRHKMVYRDLKPENILLNVDGNIKLTDFGLSKILKNKETAKTICGTAQYLAPEILTKKYTYTVDWFSLGCVIFTMLTGKVCLQIPKGAKLDFKYYKNITLPKSLSSEAIDLLKGFLKFNPKNRLGDNGIEEIKCHPFFKDLNWELLEQKKLQPPFIPKLNGPEDLSYFDKCFTDEDVDEVTSNNVISQKQSLVSDFDFVANSMALEMNTALLKRENESPRVESTNLISKTSNNIE